MYRGHLTVYAEQMTSLAPEPGVRALIDLAIGRFETSGDTFLGIVKR